MKEYPGIGIETELKNPCRTCAERFRCGNCKPRQDYTKEWEARAVQSINNLQYQLKPCPFCGETPRVSCSGVSLRFWVQCETEGCIMNGLTSDPYMVEYRDMWDLIAAWNTRKNEKGVVFV